MKNVPVLRGINIQDCCSSWLKKRPSVWMKRPFLSVTGQTGHGIDNRPGSGGTECQLGFWAGPRPMFTEVWGRPIIPHSPGFTLTAGQGRLATAGESRPRRWDSRWPWRKEMGSRFLSPTLRVCVYLKKTNTSFNWVVLVFKITQSVLLSIVYKETYLICWFK